ncbi:MAG: BspA family leucine-rich repeat surface protein [Lachnospiraceae bacterium]|nr:BspA family leucine-rich repeat surface protein [Lachnospiraceae bacterium]
MRKRILSIMLAVVVTFTAMGSNVSAAELGEAMDESIQTQTEEMETVEAESETEKQEEESAAEDTEAGTAEDMNTGSESEGEEADSDNEDSKENETDDETEGESQENGDDSAVTEDVGDESETAEEKEDVDSSVEDETEIDAGVAKKVLATSDTDIASGQYTENGSNIVWVIDANGKLTVEGTGDFAVSSRNLDNPRTPWYSNAASIKSAEINVTGMTDASFMFYNCVNLTSLDLSNFDTSEVTDMSYMFYDGRIYGEADDYGFYYEDEDSYYWDGEHLTSLDVSGFDTSKVTDMSYMFYGLRSLDSLDVSGFDTGNVTNMSHMFYGLRSLISLDVSNFSTAKVTDMSYMFYACGFDRRHGERRTSLDVSGFDTGHVTDMSNMFRECRCLASLDVSGFNTGNVTDMSGMFYCCGKLDSIDVSGFDTGKVTNMSNMFCGVYPDSLDVSGFDTGNVTDMSGMFASCGLISVDVSSFDTGNVTDMSEMFDGCNNLTRVDLGSFDTSKVTNMSGMFYCCRNLTKVDLSGLNTSNVTDMSKMFYDCESLTDIDLSNFDTANVTDMSEMFFQCRKWTRVDLSGLNTSSVTDMRGMFYSCNSLTRIDVSGFDTSNVTDMSNMFGYCTNLLQIDLSKLNTSKVISMRSMFSGCTMTRIDVSGLNTSNVTNMSNMFASCKNLISVDLNGLDTSNVTEMSSMFWGCTSLTSVDLSGFDCSSFSWRTSLDDVFNNCSALTTVYTPYRDNSDGNTYVLQLPKSSDSDVWYGYDENGEIINNISGFQLRDYSIVLMKNQVPTANTITATKANTFYEVGNTLNIDDLTVYYYDEKGAVKKVTEGYSTNANEVDMSSVGNKTLKITYNGMTAEVEIIVGVAYTVTFTGTGKDDVSFETLKVMEGADYKFWLAVNEDYVYTVTATMGEKNVRPKFDSSANSYTISNVSGNLVITVKKTFEDKSGLKISFKNEDDRKTAYIGTAIQPQIEVTYNGKKLILGTDYSVKYSNNIKIGIAKITVTGKGNFVKGNSSTTFEIVPRNIADVTLCGVATDIDKKETLTLASGATLTPVLFYNNIKLTNKDYVIRGASDAEITGKKLNDSYNNTIIKIEARSGGNFTGSREVTLNVVDKKNLTKFTVIVDKTKFKTLTYDGNPHYIHEISGAITVTAKNVAKTNMEYGKDYTIVYPSDVTNAGTKKFTVVGCGIYTGSVSKSYTIKPAKEAALSVYYDDNIVTGNRITTPFTFASSGITFSSKLTVTDGNGNALNEGKDYKVSYSGNKQVSTKAKCTITFLGNYKGHAKQTVGFEIAKADLSDAEVIIADKAYTGKAGIYKSVPYVIEDKDNANVLLKSSNYKITYYTEDPTNNDSAVQMKGKNKVGAGCTVWVKLEAKGKNYSGTQIVSYKVREAQDLSKAKITFKDTDGNTVKKMPYTGNKITDKHIKAVVNGEFAEDDADIEVIYVNNIKKGKATVIIKGTDTDICKYAGCKTATFSIVARSFSL